MRHLILLIVATLSIAGCLQSQPSAGQPQSSVDRPGILVINADEKVQPTPQNEEMAIAFSRATELAAANGRDLGYPWIDPASGELVVSAVTPGGRDLLLSAKITVPYRIREVAHGAAELEIEFVQFGYADDDAAMTAHRVNQSNMVGPAGLISMEDGEALELVQRATAPDSDGAGLVEMGGRGPLVDLDTRVNEIPVRGFWSYYSELLGIEPAGAER